MSVPSVRLSDHLHRLACPVCHGTLVLVEAAIDCNECRRRYPIVDGLPVLIASRAELPREFAE